MASSRTYGGFLNVEDEKIEYCGAELHIKFLILELKGFASDLVDEENYFVKDEHIQFKFNNEWFILGEFECDQAHDLENEIIDSIYYDFQFPEEIGQYCIDPDLVFDLQQEDKIHVVD